MVLKHLARTRVDILENTSGSIAHPLITSQLQRFPQLVEQLLDRLLALLSQVRGI